MFIVMRQRTKRKATRMRRRPAASMADVLGTRFERPVPGKWRKQYRRLTELLNALAGRRADTGRAALEAEPRFSLHMADAATDNFDRDLALGLLSSEHDAVYLIEQALDRIQNGTYGFCELTGKRIEAARLEAIPWARFSLAAEAQLEREGQIRRPGLGPRESVARIVPTEPAEEEAE